MVKHGHYFRSCLIHRYQWFLRFNSSKLSYHTHWSVSKRNQLFICNVNQGLSSHCMQHAHSRRCVDCNEWSHLMYQTGSESRCVSIPSSNSHAFSCHSIDVISISVVLILNVEQSCSTVIFFLSLYNFSWKRYTCLVSRESAFRSAARVAFIISFHDYYTHPFNIHCPI